MVWAQIVLYSNFKSFTSVLNLATRSELKNFLEEATLCEKENYSRLPANNYKFFKAKVDLKKKKILGGKSEKFKFSIT